MLYRLLRFDTWENVWKWYESKLNMWYLYVWVCWNTTDVVFSYLKPNQEANCFLWCIQLKWWMHCYWTPPCESCICSQYQMSTNSCFQQWLFKHNRIHTYTETNFGTTNFKTQTIVSHRKEKESVRHTLNLKRNSDHWMNIHSGVEYSDVHKYVSFLWCSTNDQRGFTLKN